MPKKSMNLSLDEEAIERARVYTELHKTNVSSLVNTFLSHLPAVGAEDLHSERLPPTVSRLLGATADDAEEDPIAGYHEYLMRKYGGE
jgi:hypothetical protein